MYIVVIAWGFVVILMAIAEAMSTSIVGGLMTLIFYGLIPVLIIVYLFGAPQRRRDRLEQEKIEAEAQVLQSGNESGKPDET